MKKGIARIVVNYESVFSLVGQQKNYIQAMAIVQFESLIVAKGLISCTITVLLILETPTFI